MRRTILLTGKTSNPFTPVSGLTDLGRSTGTPSGSRIRYLYSRIPGPVTDGTRRTEKVYHGLWVTQDTSLRPLSVPSPVFTFVPVPPGTRSESGWSLDDSPSSVLWTGQVYYSSLPPSLLGVPRRVGRGPQGVVCPPSMVTTLVCYDPTSSGGSSLVSSVFGCISEGRGLRGQWGPTSVSDRWVT